MSNAYFDWISCLKSITGNTKEEWQASTEILGTQLVFCDLSTPKGDSSFNVYDDIKAKLFVKVRWGQVRVLIGSTEKMGAGMDCCA